MIEEPFNPLNFKRRNQMKKFIIAASILLMAGTAWAQTPEAAGKAAPEVKAAPVTCDVNGVKELVESADECAFMGGTVVEAPKAVEAPKPVETPKAVEAPKV
jgi:hypothetical protein